MNVNCQTEKENPATKKTHKKGKRRERLATRTSGLRAGAKRGETRRPRGILRKHTLTPSFPVASYFSPSGVWGYRETRDECA